MTTATMLTFLHTRHRTVSVLLLSAVSVVGCFLWWGRLPLDNLFPAATTFASTTNVENQWFLKYDNSNNNSLSREDHHRNNNRPPPFLFQSSNSRYSADDDETGDTVDELLGERIRGGNKAYDNGNNKKSTTTSSPTSSTRSSPNYSDRPKMVWLMSYPNSGTSYTMTMVARASNRTTATNYGREVTDPPRPNVPLYPGQWEGPYYRPNREKPLPQDYILVKTHCGGRCVPCGPEEYVLNETFFLDECTRGSGLMPSNANNINNDVNNDGEDEYNDRNMEDDSGNGSSDDNGHNNDGDVLADGFQMFHYDASLVKKAIHLFRSPFDNIVSRFHLERKHFILQNRTEQVTRYNNNATGFQLWCQDMGRTYGPTLNDDNNDEQQQQSSLIPRDVAELMQPVPCHGEFYKYVQWHVMTDNVMRHRLKRPTMVVHYENYGRYWNKTATKILGFLHLEMVGVRREFKTGKDYDDYFSASDRAAAKALIQRLATPEVWQQVRRYFV